MNAGIETPRNREDLKKKVLVRIGREERRRLVLASLGNGLALMGSVALAVVGYFAIATDAARSGFFAYASLTVSDFGAAAANFSDVALSLIESFPILSGILFLSGIFFAIWSAARFTNEMTLMRERHVLIFK